MKTLYKTAVIIAIAVSPLLVPWLFVSFIYSTFSAHAWYCHITGATVSDTALNGEYRRCVTPNPTNK